MRIRARFSPVGFAVASCVLLGTTVTAAGAAAAPSITATVAFGRSAYVSGQTVTATLSVHNSGSKAVSVEAIADTGNGKLELGHGLGKFDYPVRIRAGRTVSATVSGHPFDLTRSTVTFSGTLVEPGGAHVAGFSGSTAVHLRTTTLHGEVFGDSNANGHADPGEGVVGAKVSLGYLFGSNEYIAKTGSGGRYTLVVPRAAYYIDGGLGRWHVIAQRVRVGGNAATVDLRAVHPLHRVVKASLRFTRKTYSPGDKVHVVISLVDTGTRPLRGIGAECDHVGDPNEIANTGRNWGRLAATAPGVTLQPHRPRTFHVTSRVPGGAQRLGSVDLTCDFGYAEIYSGYRPVAEDSARVPGQSGRVVGRVEYRRHARSEQLTGLANVRLVLVDPTSCPVVTRRARTGTEGRFDLGRAPAGENYRLYVFPPKGWKDLDGNPTNAQVIGRETDVFGLTVARGSAHAPKVPTRCP